MILNKSFLGKKTKANNIIITVIYKNFFCWVLQQLSMLFLYIFVMQGRLKAIEFIPDFEYTYIMIKFILIKLIILIIFTF